MDTENSRKRRRHSAELKARILAECAVPGASVAKVAMAHGMNANIVHGWRKLAREAGAVTVSLAVATTAVPSADKQTLDVELRGGTVVMKVTWPVATAADFAAWTLDQQRFNSSTESVGRWTPLRLIASEGLLNWRGTPHTHLNRPALL